MKCFFPIFFITLVGCTSIDQPVAQLQLVSDVNGMDRQLVPNKLWHDLLSKSEGHQIFIEDHQVHLGRLYVSATGQTCRKLRWENTYTANVSSISCKSTLNETWYFVESVLAEYTDKQDTSGAGK